MFTDDIKLLADMLEVVGTLFPHRNLTNLPLSMKESRFAGFELLLFRYDKPETLKMIPKVLDSYKPKDAEHISVHENDFVLLMCIVKKIDAPVDHINLVLKVTDRGIGINSPILTLGRTSDAESINFSEMRKFDSIEFFREFLTHAYEFARIHRKVAN